MKRLTRYAFAVLFCTLISIGAHAQVNPASDPCDSDYYDSLEAQAWLEAQREITQNQNLIFKPDSVLEYTCFDRYLNELADHAEDMFSETDKWGNASDTNMKDALQNLVGEPFQDYIESNFEKANGEEYDLLGGRLNDGDDDDGSTESPNEDIDHEPEDVSKGSYACDIMNQVWLKAKCMDFIDNPEEDGFFTFAEYENDDDKRFLPSRCDAIKSRWSSNRKEATVDDTTAWKEDNLKTYFDDLSPNDCSQSPAIPTGLTLVGGGSEKVCIKPGCHYDGSSCTN